MYDMNTVLEEYEPGKLKYKPKLLEQIKQMEENREKKMAEHAKMIETQQQFLSTIYNKSIDKSIDKDIDAIRNEYEKKLENKNILINELLKKIKEITIELADYKSGNANKK